MNSRYLSNIALALLGGFLLLVSQVWTLSVFSWVMLGAGIAAVALAGAAIWPSRGPAQRGLDAAIGILGAWTIVASLVFSGSVVTWLGFASGGGLLALALAGLTLHELSTERVVHSFELGAPVEERGELHTPVEDRELAGLSR
jgi:hypothetical protein